MGKEHPDQQDSEDVTVLITEIQPRLYGYILKRLADREQTLEVLQRTNLVLCRKADDYQIGSSFAAWAFTIAKFQVMAWRKSEGANRLVFSDKVWTLIEQSLEEEVADVDDRIPALQHCLERLKPMDLELVQRRYRDGEQIQQIADKLAKSVDAIGMRLMRIRRQLAECVKRKQQSEMHS